MAVDALYEVTIGARLFQQQINNVFYYERDSVAVPNAGIPEILLADFFQDTVIEELKTATSTQIDYRSVDVREVLPNFGFEQRVLPENNTGTGTGDCFPVFVAVQLFSPRQVGNIRAGFKRFAGIPESSAVNGVLLAAVLSNWQSIASTLNQNIPIEEGGSQVGFLKPVIVKRIKTVDAQNRVKYRLPETLAEMQTSGINYNAREQLTTQSSRKIGRGV